MPRLIVLNPEFGSPCCDLPDGTWTVGRSRQNQIVILDSSVSGLHCELLVNSPEVIVRDCGSRNGTFVNGVRVSPQRGVSHGQTLRIGAIEARVEIDPPLHDGAGATTAFDDYRRWLHHPNASSARPNPPPVTFRPTPSSNAPGATRTAPPPAAAPLPVPEPPSLEAKRSPKFRSWLWIILLVALLALILLRLWTT
jgi:predicted component of type VI protein secretion system